MVVRAATATAEAAVAAAAAAVQNRDRVAWYLIYLIIFRAHPVADRRWRLERCAESLSQHRDAPWVAHKLRLLRRGEVHVCAVIAVTHGDERVVGRRDHPSLERAASAFGNLTSAKEDHCQGEQRPWKNSSAIAQPSERSKVRSNDQRTLL